MPNLRTKFQYEYTIENSKRTSGGGGGGGTTTDPGDIKEIVPIDKVPVPDPLEPTTPVVTVVPKDLLPHQPIVDLPTTILPSEIPNGAYSFTKDKDGNIRYYNIEDEEIFLASLPEKDTVNSLAIDSNKVPKTGIGYQSIQNSLLSANTVAILKDEEDWMAELNQEQ